MENSLGISPEAVQSIGISLIRVSLRLTHTRTDLLILRIISGTTENVVMCTVDEDPACSASVPSTGINVPHFFYFGNGQ